jgi:hypothetical protein
MAVREFVRDGRLTWMGWLYGALALLGIGFGAYFLSTGSFLLGALLFVGAFGDSYFIWSGWKKSSPPQ